MKTISGILKLGKRERESLEVLARHSKADISYGWDGSFGGYDTEDKKAEKDFEIEIKKAQIGLEVIDFVLQITR